MLLGSSYSSSIGNFKIGPASFDRIKGFIRTFVCDNKDIKTSLNELKRAREDFINSSKTRLTVRTIVTIDMLDAFVDSLKKEGMKLEGIIRTIDGGIASVYVGMNKESRKERAKDNRYGHYRAC